MSTAQFRSHLARSFPSQMLPDQPYTHPIDNLLMIEGLEHCLTLALEMAMLQPSLHPCLPLCLQPSSRR
jgi:hypothetical protein